MRDDIDTTRTKVPRADVQRPPSRPASMPLIRLKPVKSRLVIEDGAEMILVFKVVLAGGESVDLGGGGRLEHLHGMLRIRERGGLLARADGRVAGKLVYVPEAVSGKQRAPAEFQLEVPLGPREFRVLLDLGRAGRLPHKIIVQAGERSGAGPRGLIYRSRGGRSTKFWDNVAHRRLPVGNLTFVVPVDAPDAPPRNAPRWRDEEYDEYERAERAERDRRPAAADYDDGEPHDAFASSAQVAELADELIVFQGETRHLLTAILVVVGLTALIVVVVSLLRFIR
jgi:hypothetical protein